MKNKNVGRFTAFLVILFGLNTGCGVNYPADLVTRDPQAPVVVIYPIEDVYSQARVGVLPFHMPASIGTESGAAVGALFRDVLLAAGGFPVVRLLRGDFGDPAEAVTVGKANDVDLVLAGTVHSLFPGTELGGARVELSVRLLNCSTGNTVWYLRQTLEDPWDYPDNGLLSRLTAALVISSPRPPQAGSAVPGLLTRAADDLVGLMAARH
ncbi:MAG: hypothetical protein KJ950_04060 [Proteobacteria bacterium]|nr:hypothetical protein [Pseudomonadota bacterium]MBU1688381.1 hypothetical protein [Pseudomonadota bacterium]